MFTRTILGNRIKDLRQKHKLSQDALAEKLKVTRSTIANYEAGRIIPPSQILVEIADFFEVSTDFLLGRDLSDDLKKPYYTDGQIIKKERVKRGMTQGQLADSIGVSQRTISKCEREGLANASELLDKIANVFGAFSWAEMSEKHNGNYKDPETSSETNQSSVSENKEVYTIAAHHDGEDWTEEELEEIERFKEFVRLKREKK